jgi:ketosteroid isomerase-like protein
MIMSRLAPFLACTLLLSACASHADKQRIERDKVQVGARLQHYSALVLAMDSAGIAAMYSADGELVNPSQPPVHGREAIMKYISSFSDFKVLSNADTAASILIDGDTAEQLGNYHQSVRSPEGRLFDVSGRLEISWVRDAPGEWMIQQLATFPAK